MCTTPGCPSSVRLARTRMAPGRRGQLDLVSLADPQACGVGRAQIGGRSRSQAASPRQPVGARVHEHGQARSGVQDEGVVGGQGGRRLDAVLRRTIGRQGFGPQAGRRAWRAPTRRTPSCREGVGKPLSRYLRSASGSGCGTGMPPGCCLSCATVMPLGSRIQSRAASKAGASGRQRPARAWG